jgi:hypothetical protein
MNLTILAVADCPGAELLGRRLAYVLQGRPGVTVSRQVIRGQDEAEGWGMCGSPTILIDGTDPFAAPGQRPAMSCRLYRDGEGQAQGAPTVSQLAEAVRA